MQLKDVLNNMFSFIWTEPIDVTLRRMQLVQVGLIVNSQWLLWYIVTRIEVLDPAQAAVALGAIAAALIAQIWAAVKSIGAATERDK